MAIEVRIDDGCDWSFVPHTTRLARRAAETLARHPALLTREPGTASVLLSNDSRVRELNRTYRGRDKPTNVLSFPYAQVAAGRPEAGYLGDIVFGGETVLGEARGRGIAPADHFQHLVVHGLLHLLGYDHQDDGAARTMEGIETAVLAGMGIADPHGESDQRT